MLFYTIDEVATILKINRYTVKRFIDNKQLKAVKIGKQYRISKEDLNNFISGGNNGE